MLWKIKISAHATVPPLCRQAVPPEGKAPSRNIFPTGGGITSISGNLGQRSIMIIDFWPVRTLEMEMRGHGDLSQTDNNSEHFGVHWAFIMLSRSRFKQPSNHKKSRILPDPCLSWLFNLEPQYTPVHNRNPDSFPSFSKLDKTKRIGPTCMCWKLK